MAVFKQGLPVTTSEALVTVDAGLPVGPHRFQLVVHGRGNLASAPALVQLSVQRPEPVAVGMHPPGPLVPVTPVPSAPPGPPGRPQPRRARRRGQEKP